MTRSNGELMNNLIFDEIESNVRSYCRAFPCVFDGAKDAFLWSEDGNRYIDFFAGAGTLNYGHNNTYIKSKVLAYLSEDRVLHALDMHTVAKRDFLDTFNSILLNPKGLSYKVQFTGPTGTNAVEAALKIARRVKNRTGVVAFTGAYHGMSLGALAATANKESRAAAGVPLGNVSFVPFETDAPSSESGLRSLESAIGDGHSGVDKPAAVILETVQAEGGVNPASTSWLKGVQDICRSNDVLLIVDDIQVGCFRTGDFFSFEEAGIQPDIVTISKSIGGLGFPMSLVLMRPDLDIWGPGEHTGTFRGNQIAFVAAKAALEFAVANSIPTQAKKCEKIISAFLHDRIARLNNKLKVRGRGVIWGVDLSGLGLQDVSKEVASACFKNGLIIERTGRLDAVLKILPPLTIDEDVLKEGLEILEDAISTRLATI